MQMKKGLSLMTLALAGACFLVAGCGRDSTNSASPANVAAPTIAGGAMPQLKLADLPAELNLTSAQQTQMAAALNTLSQDQARMQSQGPRGWRRQFADGASPQEVNGAPASAGSKPPLMAFVESSSQILTPDQFLILAKYLAQRREDMESQMKGRFAGHGAMAGRMAKQLGLTSDQTSRLQTAWQAQAEKGKALWQSLRSGQITSDQALAQAKTLRADMQATVQQILTADQLAAMEKFRAARQGKMQNAGGRPSAADLTQRVDDRAAFLGRVLGLSDTQAATVKQVLEGTVPQRQSLMEQMRSGALRPEEMGIEVWQIEKNAATQIRAGLTAEQAQRFDALLQLLPSGPRPMM